MEDVENVENVANGEEVDDKESEDKDEDKDAADDPHTAYSELRVLATTTRREGTVGTARTM